MSMSVKRVVTPVNPESRSNPKVGGAGKTVTKASNSA